MTETTAIRSGLPREPGGSPWPEGGAVAIARAPDPRSAESTVIVAGTNPLPHGPVRRGLPRVAGGEAWPVLSPDLVLETLGDDGQNRPVAHDPSTQNAPVEAVAVAHDAPVEGVPTVPPSRAQTTSNASRRRAVILVGGAVIGLAIVGVIIMTARWVLQWEGAAWFFALYPGSYELPDGAPEGLPAWLGWQHFFNFFFMVLIVRSGLRVRNQAKPAAYWTSRRDPDKNWPIELWLHTSLDVLWATNGVIFFVLLFSTGQWMRIVPTSWEVVPNALSATVQYASLMWPTEDGWANYNSLQQLAYFTTVFIAAPLASVTGARLSALWSSRLAGLSRLMPLDLARRLHYPVMLYFVAFTIVHVALVLSTGALRNLNHIFAARDADDAIGLITFVGALAVTAIAWFVVRPSVVVVVARRFGTVSSR